VKLPDFLKDPDLNALRERMGGAALGSFRLSVNPYRFTIPELESLLEAGIDVEDLGCVRALEDRTLAYKDRRVLLYRREVPLPSATKPRPGDLPHFHFSDCPIVQRLRDAGASSRHVVAAREDGCFLVDLLQTGQPRPSLERLPVCEECLGELAFDGFTSVMHRESRIRAAAGFSVTRFFTQYRRALLPGDPAARPPALLRA
jgi:hypothetical protein